jgi:hypothetical protein
MFFGKLYWAGRVLQAGGMDANTAETQFLARLLVETAKSVSRVNKRFGLPTDDRSAVLEAATTLRQVPEVVGSVCRVTERPPAYADTLLGFVEVGAALVAQGHD